MRKVLCGSSKIASEIRAARDDEVVVQIAKVEKGIIKSVLPPHDYLLRSYLELASRVMSAVIFFVPKSFCLRAIAGGHRARRERKLRYARNLY